MKLLNPHEDRNLVHSEPFDIWLGADPMRYPPKAFDTFTVIVNLRDFVAADRSSPLGTVVLHYSMKDLESRSALPERESLEDFLAAVHVLAGKGSSLWHCFAGLNRSGLALAAYLHLYRGLPIREAIQLLREKRCEYVLSNKVFAQALIEWYG